MRTLTKAILIGAFLGQLASSATAAEETIGKREYMTSCATCHGAEGDGNGSFSAFLKTSVPDLTQLAKNNGGKFPLNRVYGIIDGREAVKGHGDRYMTIWGSRYNADALEQLDPFGPTNKAEVEAMVRGRILELVFYVESIQK